MASFEMWTCDWHDGDLTAASGTFEDQALDQGWACFFRREQRESVFPAIPGTPIKELRLSPRLVTDYRHVCDRCLLDADCREWLDGWKPYGPDNAENYGKALAAYGKARADADDLERRSAEAARQLDRYEGR